MAALARRIGAMHDRVLSDLASHGFQAFRPEDGDPGRRRDAAGRNAALARLDQQAALFP